MTEQTEKRKRGFAAMSPERQREIASRGGRSARDKGTAHRWNAEQAKAAGKRGGTVSRGGQGKAAPEVAE